MKVSITILVVVIVAFVNTSKTIDSVGILFLESCLFPGIYVKLSRCRRTFELVSEY